MNNYFKPVLSAFERHRGLICTSRLWTSGVTIQTLEYRWPFRKTSLTAFLLDLMRREVILVWQVVSANIIWRYDTKWHVSNHLYNRGRIFQCLAWRRLGARKYLNRIPPTQGSCNNASDIKCTCQKLCRVM